MPQAIGGFKRDADFPRHEAKHQDDTIMESEVNEPSFLEPLTKSSLNARKQSPYGPQFPNLEKYFKAK